MISKSLSNRSIQGGFTLIEIMIALAIGMLTVLIIMQTVASAENLRRQSSSGSDANTSGALALQNLQRDLMATGAGMTGDNLNVFTTCHTNGVNAYNSARTPNDIGFLANTFAPVSIWSANDVNAASTPSSFHLKLKNSDTFDTDTDVIQIISGGSNLFFGRGISVGAWSDPTVFPHPTVPDVTWDPIPGLHAGDLVIAVEAGRACVISQVTLVSNQGNNVAGETGCNFVASPSTTSAAHIQHSAGAAFKNFYAGCTSESTSYWNKVGASTLGVALTNAQLYSLGPPERLTIRAYGIINGRLMACAPMYVDCTEASNWQVYGDGIISLRAEYGYDTDNDQAIASGEWTRTLPATPAWGRLKAVRLGIVSRSKQIERNIVSGSTCAPAWSGFATEDATCANAVTDGQMYLGSGHDGANWNRYHYKVFETTVQLRNLFWNN